MCNLFASRRLRSCLIWTIFLTGFFARSADGQQQEVSPTTAQAEPLPNTTQPSETQTAPLTTAPSSRAAIIPIRGEITGITKDSLQRRLDYIREQGIDLVILEMDTPGGALMATLDMCDMLKEFRDNGGRIYTWVNDNAYSAGTIMALATDGILMTSNATIGDCQPIMMVGGGPAAVPEEIKAKLTSPLVAELEDSARRNGYDLDLVLSFIRPKMQIFWVVNTETGEKRFVDPRDRNELFGWIGSSDRGLLGAVRGGGKPTGAEPLPDSQSRTEWRYVKNHPLLGNVVQPVVSDQVLLTMKTSKAKAFGFCPAAVNSRQELRSTLNVEGDLEVLKITPMETVVQFLASPTMRGILFMLMLLGAYMEFQSPGLGLPGAVAIVALAIFLGAPYMAGFTVTWEIVVIILGLALIAVEVFVIPGFGVAGISGMILLVFGLLASFIPAEPGKDDFFHIPNLPATYEYLEYGIYSIGSGLVGALILMALWVKYMPRTSLGSKIIAPNPTPAQVTVDDPYKTVARVGDEGKATSPLRPVGRARFGDMLVDVVSEGDYIQPGEKVRVMERHGNRIVVRRAE
jgi:membrane-bound serine protease (ClpP class)